MFFKIRIYDVYFWCVYTFFVSIGNFFMKDVFCSFFDKMIRDCFSAFCIVILSQLLFSLRALWSAPIQHGINTYTRARVSFQLNGTWRITLFVYIVIHLYLQKQWASFKRHLLKCSSLVLNLRIFFAIIQRWMKIKRISRLLLQIELIIYFSIVHYIIIIVTLQTITMS